MNIFKELKKAPKVDINEVSYGVVRLTSDEHRRTMKELVSSPEWKEKHLQGIQNSKKRGPSTVRYIDSVRPFYKKWKKEIDDGVPPTQRKYSATFIANKLDLDRTNVLNYLKSLSNQYSGVSTANQSKRKKQALKITMKKKWQDPTFRSKHTQKQNIEKEKRKDLVRPYFRKHIEELASNTAHQNKKYSYKNIAELTGISQSCVRKYIVEMKNEVDTT